MFLSSPDPILIPIVLDRCLKGEILDFQNLFFYFSILKMYSFVICQSANVCKSVIAYFETDRNRSVS